MDKKLIKCFLKDQVVNTIAYFIGNFLIGLFYYMDTQEKLEIIYPLAISLFVYLCWMLYHFAEYYRYYKSLANMVKFHDYDGRFQSAINSLTSDSIKKLHMEYLDKLGAAEVNRKKDRRFLSLWIHNMKTPISVTDLILQRIERGEIKATDGMQTLKEENKKLLSILDAVLNMLRLEEFAKDYVPEQLNLLEELNSIINKNKSLFINNHVFPKLETDLTKAIILSDKKWNELMIHQIISNAVKYSKSDADSPKNIYFHIERINNEIVLTIRDEGIGIPEHDIGKVFEPFFTGDNGRKGYRSSGIGLYFCREVSRMLGHTLKISSETGKGTCVRISYIAKL